MSAVSVVTDALGDRHLKVNDRFRMGGTASYFSDRRQAHIPLLLHPDPGSALFLGLGTGATFAAAADYRGLEAEGVELIPEIISLLPYFEKSSGNALTHPRLRVRVADARRFVNASPRTYDVIVADLFHPARDGAGSLYTVEHFQAIRSLLNPGGLFCQWLPLYQLDLATLRVIVRTYLHVFPAATAYLAHYSLETPMLGLISPAVPGGRYPHDWFATRVQDPRLDAELRSLRLHGLYSLFGHLVAGDEDLAAFAGEGPLNTDDRPLVIFGAPYFVHTEQQPAYARLLALVDQFAPQSKDILTTGSTGEAREAHRRLVSYWEARDSFLRAGVGVVPTEDLRKMLQQVRDSLLAVIRKSPDFEAAYNPLLGMALRLREIDADAARDLLVDLTKANPSREEARIYLERFFWHPSSESVGGSARR